MTRFDEEPDAPLHGECAAEIQSWMDTAAQMSRNADFYRGLIDECAKHLGDAVYTADDGSVSDEPLRLKILELVAELRRQASMIEPEESGNMVGMGQGVGAMRPITGPGQITECHCPPDKCEAPIVMGQQTPCLMDKGGSGMTDREYFEAKFYTQNLDRNSDGQYSWLKARLMWEAWQAAKAWQPIELAPKDRPILLWRPTAFEWGRVTMGQWSDDKYGKKPKPFWSGELWGIGIIHSREWTPTMWMEIPK